MYTKDFALKTFNLFNGVLSNTASNANALFDTKTGLMLMPGTSWAKSTISKSFVDSNGLNKSFFSSWSHIQSTPIADLISEQLKHYESTYGSDFKDDIYIPLKVKDAPEDFRVRAVHSLTKEEIIERSLNMINSGIALQDETIKSLFSILDDLGYEFKTVEDIKNKEIQVRVLAKYKVKTDDPVIGLRALLHKAIDSTLLIKDKKTIDSLSQLPKGRKVELLEVLSLVPNVKLASVFNRFKPIFLALKGTKETNQFVNRISKLSKAKHQPMVVNALSLATSRKLEKDDMHWIKSATTFALLKALNACHMRMYGRTNFLYRIRNGRSWFKEDYKKQDFFEHNYTEILNEIKSRVDNTPFIYIPDNIKYGLPTSEKMFIGNIPFGTRVTGNITAGIYWENKWGARDLDLGAFGVGHAVSWTNQRGSADLMYSGDITSAPDGAVEFMSPKNRKGLNNFETPYVLNCNVFSDSKEEVKFKIIVSDTENTDSLKSKDLYNHVMDPNTIIAETFIETKDRETAIGFYDVDGSFVFANFSSGNRRVGTAKTGLLLSLIEEFKYSITLNDLLKDLGFVLTNNRDEATIDLSFNNISKDTVFSIFR